MISQPISDYLYQIQSQGRYLIGLQELKEKFCVDNDDKALLQKLHRLKSENKLAQVRKEFYVIVPPEYSHQGILPVTYYIDDMMQALDRDYYIGLYSAAALHGAAHQQPMESQIIVQKPALRNVTNKKQQKLAFFTKSNWDASWVDKKKTDAGYVAVSSPELTIIDLILYHKKIGGLNRILPILEELTELIKSQKFIKILTEINTATIQRLGYVFEIMGEQELSRKVLKLLEKRKMNNAKLSLAHKTNSGEKHKTWNLIINTQLDY
jgi:predicted transcriptional regulator of viral defense system